jgi:hypothetical protein
MGHLQAMEMAAYAPLRAALTWHLTANHFPPVPEAWVPVCERVIHGLRDETLTMRDMVENPVNPGLKHTVSAIVHTLHLNAWLEIE